MQEREGVLSTSIIRKSLDLHFFLKLLYLQMINNHYISWHLISKMVSSLDFWATRAKKLTFSITKKSILISVGLMVNLISTWLLYLMQLWANWTILQLLLLKVALGVCFALKLWKEYLLLFTYLTSLGKDATFPLITKFKTNKYLSYLSVNRIPN